jgi:hypothetical protein
MLTKPPTEQERTAHPTPSVADIRLKNQLGTDAEGHDHYLCPIRQTVYVLDGDTIVHTEDLAERPLGDWMGYVAAARGWARQYYTSDLRTLFERAGLV